MSTAKQDSPGNQKKPAGGSTGAAETTSAASKPQAAGGKQAAVLSQSGQPEALPRKRRPFVALLAVAATLVIAGLGYAWYRAEHPAETPGRLSLEGNIDVRQVNLAFKVDGRIESLAVDEGDVVKAGEVVATLDSSYFKDDLRVARARRASSAATLARLEHGSRPEEIASAKAQVAEQRATLARAQQDYDRAERLVSPGAVSRESFDQAKSALAESDARLKVAEENERMAVIGPRVEDIEQARAQLAVEDAAIIQIERRLADAELIAPNDGVILTRAREKGAIVSAGETVFTLTLSSPVWVRTYVNERDLGRIHPGMTAEVRTDSAPDKIYHGKIGFISPTAEFTPKTVETRELRTNLVYRLRVLVDNPDNGLRQGMPVTVELDLDEGK
ncbi:MAG TPA: secretion protein HlyD [Pirellulales bacterium]|jgi:HlyD family secretion protein